MTEYQYLSRDDKRMVALMAAVETSGGLGASFVMATADLYLEWLNRNVPGMEKDPNEEIERLRELVLRFADGEPCHYDHHNYCQAHTLHNHPCPYGIANEMDAEHVDD